MKFLILMAIVWISCAAVCIATKDDDALTGAFIFSFLAGIGYLILTTS